MSHKKDLLDLIDKKLTEAKERNHLSPRRKPPTRAESNRANGKQGVGPRTIEGKQRASANSLKHGYYAAVDHLNPYDSASYVQTYGDLRSSLHPDGPVEEMLIKELAMFTARLKRLEAAEYALILGNIDAEPPNTPAPRDPKAPYEDPKVVGEVIQFEQSKPFDLNCDDLDLTHEKPSARAMAAAYERCLETLERLQRIETHLRRAYNLTWDRLQRMQKERTNLPLDEMLKRTHAWLTAEALRKNRPQDIPALHPDMNAKGKFKHYDKNHPMYRPRKDEEDD